MARDHVVVGAALAAALLAAGLARVPGVGAADAPAPTPPAPAPAVPTAPAVKPAEAVRLAPGGKYPVHTMDRPRPRVVDPGTGAPPPQPGVPPADAILLFDGKDLSQWVTPGAGEERGKLVPPKWKVENGYFEVVPRTGSIFTREKFGDCQIHLEWATPEKVRGRGQAPGNSGVYLPYGGELQVLNSYENDTYPDGQAAAFYGRFPPLVNASRKPGEWQCYDIVVQMAKGDNAGKVIRPGLVTVLHNGVLVHHAVETGSRAKEGTLGLQDHGEPVRYRNIWIRKLKDYDEE